MGRRVLRRHIWGYSVCLCPIKGTPGLTHLIVISTVYTFCLISRQVLYNRHFFSPVVCVWIFNLSVSFSNLSIQHYLESQGLISLQAHPPPPPVRYCQFGVSPVNHSGASNARRVNDVARGRIIRTICQKHYSTLRLHAH